jgi:hypothetical protein
MAHVFGEGERIRVVRGNAANPGIDRERHLDEPVEGGFAIDGAE